MLLILFVSQINLGYTQILTDPGVSTPLDYKNNPLYTCKTDSWDCGNIGGPFVVYWNQTYYLFYHATGDQSYQIGVLSSYSILGPWIPLDKPILELGTKNFIGNQIENSWEKSYVIEPSVHYLETENKWYMWYQGYNGIHLTIGIATADHPLGPWEKHTDNPIELHRPNEIINDPGRFHNVIVKDGVYYLYAGIGPINVWTSSTPSGPWTFMGSAIEVDKNQEDAFGASDVSYFDNKFHMLITERDIERKFEVAKLSYASSDDGINWERSQIANLAPSGQELTWNNYQLGSPQLFSHKGNILIFTGSLGNINAYPQEFIGLYLIVNPEFKNYIDIMHNGQWTNSTLSSYIRITSITSELLNLNLYFDDGVNGPKLHRVIPLNKGWVQFLDEIYVPPGNESVTLRFVISSSNALSNSEEVIITTRDIIVPRGEGQSLYSENEEEQPTEVVKTLKEVILDQNLQIIFAIAVIGLILSLLLFSMKTEKK